MLTCFACWCIRTRNFGREALSTFKVNVAELLDNSDCSTYQKWLTVLVAMAVIFDGFDIQILVLPFRRS
jgi:hypothetical protein